LRAAAPWQPIRRIERPAGGGAPRIDVRPDDIRITRYRQRSESVSIFVVDASGSSALHRLAEAKGAIEMLLAECYIRRDQVALLAFRGEGADLLLPPTRSLVRAKRGLAALPGGGGTPLAHGIDAAFAVADGERRRGRTPTVVLLSDGRANIARDGSHGRAKAHEDACAAARRLRAEGVSAIVIDTSPRPHPQAADIARQMDAVYLPLPRADAAAVSRAVQALG
jgi:magnesium chelatase subunit D